MGGGVKWQIYPKSANFELTCHFMLCFTEGLFVLHTKDLTRQERLGLAHLKKDKDRVILTADKGVAVVVMDREDYITKTESLLSQPAYRLLPRDPTNQIKAQLINKLRRIKKNNNLEEGMYKAMYPTGCIPPMFYGSPQIHNR